MGVTQVEKILLFQTGADDAAKVRAAAKPLHIRVEEIETGRFLEPLGQLAGISQGFPAALFTKEPPSGSLLVFCQVEDKKIDRMLAGLCEKQAAITYKAVLTPVNAAWNVPRLYLEMEAERRAYAKLGR